MRAAILSFATLLFSPFAIARADLIVNGGFEAPALAPGAFLTIGPGGEPAGFGWTVSSGNVDVGHLPVSPFIAFDAFEGNQGLDLNGTQRGAIFQDFATNVGQMYLLSFVYADNPVEGGVSSADILVSDAALSTSLLSDSVFHSTSTNTPVPDADFGFYSSSFTATGTLTRLAFSSTSASNTPSGGILLDAVSVVAVPEPSSLITMLAGLGMFSFARRRLASGSRMRSEK